MGRGKRLIFKRKKKKKSRVEIKHIPLPILMRQAIYDSMLEPAEGIAESLGLPPISDEVAEMEELESQKRLERFASLIPFIDSHSDLASRIISAAYLLDDDDNDLEVLKLGADMEEKLVDLFKIVAISSSVSCISTLFNLGLLESKVETDVE
jgi:hypothetical protein